MLVPVAGVLKPEAATVRVVVPVLLGSALNVTGVPLFGSLGPVIVMGEAGVMVPTLVFVFCIVTLAVTPPASA
jgi:hypothetical protein